MNEKEKLAIEILEKIKLVEQEITKKKVILDKLQKKLDELNEE